MIDYDYDYDSFLFRKSYFLVGTGQRFPLARSWRLNIFQRLRRFIRYIACPTDPNLIWGRSTWPIGLEFLGRASDPAGQPGPLPSWCLSQLNMFVLRLFVVLRLLITTISSFCRRRRGRSKSNRERLSSLIVTWHQMLPLVALFVIESL
jgi:hypothetical protein